MALIGTETEYGIATPERPGLDPSVLSALVVDAHAGPATPSHDGIHNRVLGNGARLYVDHGHPEYSAPECTNPTDATVHELAGDAIVLAAARAASEVAGTPIRLFKNNTDGKGNAYGYHENHLLSRATSWRIVERYLPTFLVTRIILTGAGRVGLGRAGERPGFQLSQRADFFERVSGLDTTQHRGIVNTRDEPHALPSRYRRLHVITGDANRNPFATWLKLGTASLFLATLEHAPDTLPVLSDPVAEFRAISHAVDVRAAVGTEAGRSSVVDVQRRVLDACAHCPEALAAPEADDLLAEWASALDDLAADPASTADRLDWPAKLGLLERLRERDGLGWGDPRLALLDLAWADLEPTASVFSALQRSGRLVDWIDPDAVARAGAEPPADTRAHARGRLVADHPDAVVAATWDSVLVRDDRGGLHTLRMSEPLDWTAAIYPRGVPPLRRARGRG